MKNVTSARTAINKKNVTLDRRKKTLRKDTNKRKRKYETVKGWFNEGERQKRNKKKKEGRRRRHLF